jgi:hypothetical protein
MGCGMSELGQLLRDCRMRVCEAYYWDGPQAALAAVVDASIELAPLVADGELEATAAWDTLQDVAANLTLVEGFGQDVVQEAIAFGPRVYLLAERHATPLAVAA